MGIEGIFIGYGIEIPYRELLKKLKIKTKKPNGDEIIDDINKYLLEAHNQLLSKKMCIIRYRALPKSHGWERSDESSGSEGSNPGSSDDDDDTPANVYFGSLKIYVNVCIYIYFNEAPIAAQ